MFCCGMKQEKDNIKETGKADYKYEKGSKKI